MSKTDGAAGRTLDPRAMGLGWVVVDAVMRLEQLPAENSKAEAYDSFKQVGGPVVRALSVLAALEIQSDLVSQVGDDVLGQFARHSLEQRNVGASFVREEAGGTTRQAQVWLGMEQGSRTIVYHRGELPDLQLHPETERAARQADVLLFDGRDLPAARHLIRAVGPEVPVVIDAGGWKTGLETLVGRATLIILSSSAFETGPAGPGSAQSFAEEIVATSAVEAVLVTSGSKGVTVIGRGRPPVAIPSMDVEVVDSNGAGDVYLAGLAFGLLRGMPIEKNAHRASLLAALSCRHVGDSFLGAHELATWAEGA